MSDKPESNDEAVLRMLAGANFGPDAGLTLPSGKELGGGEAQAWTSVYADDAEKYQPEGSLAAMRQRALAQQATERDRHQRRFEMEHKQAQRSLERMLDYLRPAEVGEYESWLKGYMDRGGKPSHFYDYPTPTDRLYVASRDFTIKPLYGSMSIRVIVPKHITVTGNPGHSSVYLMEGFTMLNAHPWVPCYSDTHL
jgi:hypothetical protein